INDDMAADATDVVENRWNVRPPHKRQFPIMFQVATVRPRYWSIGFGGRFGSENNESARSALAIYLQQFACLRSALSVQEPESFHASKRFLCYHGLSPFIKQVRD